MSAPANAFAHDVAADAVTLRNLHVPGKPLMLPNVWDPPSARVAASAGVSAIATASAALAPVNGYEDHGRLPPDVAFGALRRIADAVALPVTADLEDGYGLSPEDFADRLLGAGACGANLEDTDHRAGALVDADRQAERIAAVKRAARARGVDAVINARIDVHFHKASNEEGLARARQYFAAGADCVYPIFLSDPAVIRQYAALGPTNILYGPDMLPPAELAALGVARISVGPFLFRLLQTRLDAAVRALCRFDGDGAWT